MDEKELKKEAKIREAMRLKEKQWSDSMIAKRLGISEHTVRILFRDK